MLVVGSCQGFLNDNCSLLFALPHPSPCQEFGIFSVSEQLPLTGFILTSLLGVNYNR